MNLETVNIPEDPTYKDLIDARDVAVKNIMECVKEADRWRFVASRLYKAAEEKE